MPGDGAALGVDGAGKKIRTQSRVFARTWVAATTYYLGEFVRPTAANGHVYRATAVGSANTISGVSHASTQPTWPTTLGQTVTDNSGTSQIIWTEWGTDLFHDQYSINTDETTGNTARVLNASPASTDYGLLTRPIPPVRAPRVITTSGATATTISATTETLLNFVSILSYTASGTVTTVTLTASKTLRIQAITLAQRSVTATANYSRINIRLRTDGTTVTASTGVIIASALLTGTAANANSGSQLTLAFPEGLEIVVPASPAYTLGITANNSAAQTAVIPEVTIHGYEY